MRTGVTFGVTLALCSMAFYSIVRIEQKQLLQEAPAVWYNEEVAVRHKGVADQVIPLATHNATATDVTMTLEYDNSKPKQELYYQTARTATLTIVDPDFDADRVVIEGTATATTSSSGEEAASIETISFPSLSKWTSRGSRHTATLAFTEDARYTYEGCYLDEHGKKLAVYPSETFVIDQKRPVVEVSGVTHQTSNTKLGIVQIEVSDAHLEGEQVSVTLTGAKRGKLTLPTSSEQTAPTDGADLTQWLHKLDLARITAGQDDIYTLTVTAADRAGNKTDQQTTFTLNQQGSRYAADGLPAPPEGERWVHLQAPQAVTVVETNPDALTAESAHVMLRHNGVWRTLTPEEDYQVTESGGGDWNTKKQWHTYTYRLSEELFAADGAYEVAFASEDEAGNQNYYGSPATASTDSLASFWQASNEEPVEGVRLLMDRTPPLVTALNLASGGELPRGRREATFRVLDNVDIDTVQVWLNGDKVTPTVEEQYYRVSLSPAPFAQSLMVRAVDTTGNETDFVIEDFYLQGRFLFERPDRIKRAVTLLVVGGWVALLWWMVRKKRRQESTPPSDTDTQTS